MPEILLSDSAANALAGTVDAVTGTKFPAANQDPWLAAYVRQLYHLATGIAAAANNLRVYADDSAGTTIGVRAGRCTIDGTSLAYAGGLVTGLTNNAVTYVWAYNLAGTLTINSAVSGTGWPGVSHVKLAEVTIASGAVTAILDRRLDNLSNVAGGGTYQPLDATLTALAALTITANSLSIGTAADTFSQTAFAANTFPARASTGSLVAKTITDFGLSLVDDASASVARTTLGLVIGTDVQAYDADLLAIAGLTSAADKGIMFTGAGAAATFTLTAAALTVLDDTTVAAMVNTLGGATSSGTGGLVRIDSATLTGTPSAPTAASTTNTTQLATTAFVQQELSGLTGVLKLKGSTDCSANPNYPAASAGWTYIVTVAGKIGGASGKSVDVGDTYIATADNAGGTEASVGTSWTVLEHNLAGALLSANNLSDVASASTARTNLGLAIGSNVQAYSAVLAAIAALTNAADKLPYFAGGGTAATTDLTSLARTLLACSTTATMRAAMGTSTTFADATARAAATPEHVGQLALQLDTFVIYRATGTSAGNWTSLITDDSGNIVGPVLVRTGTAATIDGIVLSAGEVAVTSDTHEVRLGDGSTSGGVAPLGSAIAGNWFGSGVSGSATISGDTTLDGPRFYTNLTINSTFTLNTGGWPVFVSGTLTVNGTIGRPGNNGTTASSTSGATGGSSLSSTGTPELGGSHQGGTGGNGGTAAGSAAGILTSPSPLFIGGLSGRAGGAGGAGSGGAGGSGGTGPTGLGAPIGRIDHPLYYYDGGGVLAYVPYLGGVGSKGGGGGGGDGTAGGGGGGGGSGGGIVRIFAKTIVVGASGLITAKGGNGGNGFSPVAGNRGGGGGGSGGSGGYLELAYKTLTNGGTISAGGGTKGTGGVKTGTGVNGSDGSDGAAGTLIKFNVSTQAYE